MTAREKDRAARRVARIKALLALCSKEERAAIFRELGCCACLSLARVAAENPAAAVGGVIGTMIGVVISAKKQNKSPLPLPFGSGK